MLKIAKAVSLFSFLLSPPLPSFLPIVPLPSSFLLSSLYLFLPFSPLFLSFFLSLISPPHHSFSSLLFSLLSCKSKLHLLVEDHLASAGQKGILQETLHFLHGPHLPNKVGFLFFTCSLHVIFSKPILHLAEPVQPFKIIIIIFLPSCFWYSACYSDFLSKFLAHNP